MGNGMKGIVLAGGLGSRLAPLTQITNKHLLPVYDKPMIYYPIEALVKADITDIMIVTGGNSAGDFLKLLGNGQSFGLKDVYYTYQRGEGGIAEALSLCEHFADGEKVIVILGDNIFEDDLLPFVDKFRHQEQGARIFLKEVSDPERFGVPEIKDGKIIKIEEKPKNPKSGYAVTGIYMYDETVFDIAKTLKPSKRGELEISDVNNSYIKNSKLEYDILKGYWTDAGTFESLFNASHLVREKSLKSK